MKVKKEGLFFKMVKNKRSMQEPNHPYHTAMNFIGNVIHTIWVYGLLPLLVLSGIFILFSQNSLSEEKCFLILFISWFGYIALLFFSIILLMVVEPFVSKKWRKLIIT